MENHTGGTETLPFQN